MFGPKVSLTRIPSWEFKLRTESAKVYLTRTESECKKDLNWEKGKRPKAIQYRWSTWLDFIWEVKLNSEVERLLEPKINFLTEGHVWAEGLLNKNSSLRIQVKNWMWHSCASRVLSIPKEGVQISAKEAGPTGGRQVRESSAECLLSRTFSRSGTTKVPQS